MPWKLLTDKQWDFIKLVLPKQTSKGRPFMDDRRALQGILWVLYNHQPWRTLPDAPDYAGYSTCRRRLKFWRGVRNEDKEFTLRSGYTVWQNIWHIFVQYLSKNKLANWMENLGNAKQHYAGKSSFYELYFVVIDSIKLIDDAIANRRNDKDILTSMQYLVHARNPDTMLLPRTRQRKATEEPTSMRSRKWKHKKRPRPLPF